MPKTTEQAQAATPDLASHSAMIFGTPLISYPWAHSESLNQGLQEIILKRETDATGLDRSNVGGWHSDTDFFTWDDDGVRTLRERVRQLTTSLTQMITLAREGPRRFNYRLDGWANVNRRGSYNTVHNHPNCLWSGVYYVSAGVPDEDAGEQNGKLELLDPRVGSNLMYINGTVLESRYLVEPQPGLMLMFPSWLNHLVHPFAGQGERISVAFNIVATEVPAAEELA